MLRRTTVGPALRPLRARKALNFPASSAADARLPKSAESSGAPASSGRNLRHRKRVLRPQKQGAPSEAGADSRRTRVSNTEQSLLPCKPRVNRCWTPRNLPNAMRAHLKQLSTRWPRPCNAKKTWLPKTGRTSQHWRRQPRAPRDCACRRERGDYQDQG